MTYNVRGFRRLLPIVWAGVLRVCGGLWWARRELRRSGAVVVFLLHRILDENDYRQTRSLSNALVRSRTFEDFAIYLARHCQTVPLKKAAPGNPSGKVKVALTFDDGWRDAFTTALPVVLACGLPATVFLCTGLTGCLAPFWPERMMAALRAMRPEGTDAEAEVFIEHLQKYTPQERARWMEDLARTLGAESQDSAPFESDCTMTWEEISEMDQAGVSFGSHTHTHRVLATVGPAGVRREIRDSRMTIERKLLKDCDLFAYPEGSQSPDARRILEEEGFRLAFTNERTAWTPECDPLLIPRVAISERDLTGLRGRFSAASFEYNIFWRIWQEMRTRARKVQSAPCSERAAA